jgi:resuscitation-promoting factor RpfB
LPYKLPQCIFLCYDNQPMRKHVLFLITLLLFAAACRPAPQAQEFIVSLVADGRERTFSYTSPVTVDEFLGDAGIELGELDSVNPQPFTQITDGMRVTVVRIQESHNCEEQTVPFTQRTVPNEGLEPGEERLGQAGQNGVIEVCFRVQVRDGVPHDPVEISRTVITQPQEEIIYVGPSGEIAPVVISGTLAYISNRNAWVMRGSSTTKQPLTTSSDVDGRVFAISPDGQQLLFTRQAVSPGDENATFNQLWLIPGVPAGATPIELLPDNILYGDWVPGEANTISYSTGEARATAPGWQAYNDLWVMRVDPLTGESLNVREVVERSSGGLYGWWGTNFQWSNDGTQLAWARADSAGLIDQETGEYHSLVSYPVFNTFQSWSWRATLSWSPDDTLLLTTVHGQPIGSEPAETSPAFHVAVADTSGAFEAEVVRNAGIWANPRYSPDIINPDSELPSGYLAYLTCRDFPNCVSDDAEYDLMISDRDGSNARELFPPNDQPGLTQRDFVWSPDGQQIAFIYQGNLWIIDIQSQVASQLTLDGGASKPVWTR